MILDEWITWLSEAWTPIAPLARTVAVYAAAIAIYTAIVFTFYERISRRRLIQLEKGSSFKRIATRILEALTVLPAIALAYSIFLAIALSFLAKDRASQDVILLALSVVIGIRFTSVFGQGMAVDLAKLLPLGLLAVVLVDPGYFEFDLGAEKLREAFGAWPLFVWGAVALVLLEIILQSVGALRERKERRRTTPKNGRVAEGGPVPEAPRGAPQRPNGEV